MWEYTIDPPLDGLWVQITQRMVFDKVRLDESQVKRNSPRRHEGIHMYQHQMEDCSLPVKLELKDTHMHIQ